MYVFSANAKAKDATQGLAQGQKALFIVYINSADRKAAEKLCRMQLLRAGFHEIEIEKGKLVQSKALADPKLVAAHRGLKEALDQGYSIHLFDED